MIQLYCEAIVLVLSRVLSKLKRVARFKSGLSVPNVTSASSHWSKCSFAHGPNDSIRREMKLLTMSRNLLQFSIYLQTFHQLLV